MFIRSSPQDQLTVLLSDLRLDVSLVRPSLDRTVTQSNKCPVVFARSKII